MSDPVFAFSDRGVTEAYQKYLVPLLFAPWARVLIEALDVRAGESLVDVACGPGTVAKAAAERVGESGFVVATDLSPEMLEVARETTPASARIRYECAPAERLPAADASFDALTCQQGLQFFSDRVAAIAEMRRVLRADGRAGIATWTTIEDAPFLHCVREAIATALPDIAAQAAKPFSLPDPKMLKSELEAGGFDVVVDTFSLPLEFESLERAVEAIRGQPIWPHIAALPTPARANVLESVREGFSRYLHHGRVLTAMRSNLAIARRRA